jgi:hypothetical protein
MRGGVRTLTVVATVCLLAAIPVARANPSSKYPDLQRYLTSISAPIASAFALHKRLDAILTQRPIVNVDPKVEKLYKVADDFDKLAVRWRPVPAPRGLRARHRGMGRTFELQAEGWRIYAAGLFTRHDEDLHAAIARLGARLRSAAYLQKRWAAALRGALIRAELRVPKWLREMASAPEVLTQS